MFIYMYMQIWIRFLLTSLLIYICLHFWKHHYLSNTDASKQISDYAVFLGWHFLGFCQRFDFYISPQPTFSWLPICSPLFWSEQGATEMVTLGIWQPRTIQYVCLPVWAAERSMVMYIAGRKYICNGICHRADDDWTFIFYIFSYC